MRLGVLALLLALVLGTVQAMPLQGGNEIAKATLFGAVRTSLGDANATEENLNLDLGLIGAENATYRLVDSKDNISQPSSYGTLLPTRQMLTFIVPKDSLFKFINVAPTTGQPFNINWWETPKGTNGDLIIRYYGFIDWLADPEQQSLAIQLRLGNNGTSDLTISPENFTLLDQWGWDYYPILGFDPVVLKPGQATGRVHIGYAGISPLSKITALAYDYGEPSQIIIDLDKDQGPLSDAVVYGTNATGNATAAASVLASQSQAQAAETTASPAASAPAVQASQSQAAPAQSSASTAATSGSLKDEINATKERLGVSESDGSPAAGSSTVGDKTRAGVEDAKKRLDEMKRGLSSSKNEL
jgi:hypothetical protein